MSAEPSDPDEIRRVLRAWCAVEVLTPGKVEEGGWSSFAQAQRGQLAHRAQGAGVPAWHPPHDDDPTPWPPAVEVQLNAGGIETVDCSVTTRDTTAIKASVEPSIAATISAKRREPRAWYKIVLAALPTRDAMRRLDAVFEDQPDADTVTRKEKGHILAATLILDEVGTLVPDSLTIASFAWGLGKLASEGPHADLSAWIDVEESLISEVSAWLSPTDKTGRVRPPLWSEIRQASQNLQRRLSVADDLWVVVPCAVRIMALDAPTSDLL
ncbi:MAG: hypothetical protein EOO77_07555, partial [Oxalobacteraceae bacterium]